MQRVATLRATFEKRQGVVNPIVKETAKNATAENATTTKKAPPRRRPLTPSGPSPSGIAKGAGTSLPRKATPPSKGLLKVPGKATGPSEARLKVPGKATGGRRPLPPGPPGKVPGKVNMTPHQESCEYFGEVLALRAQVKDLQRVVSQLQAEIQALTPPAQFSVSDDEDRQSLLRDIRNIRRKKLAIIAAIGSGYEESKRLKNPENDCLQMQERLEGLGFVTTCMINSECTRENVLRSIFKFHEVIDEAVGEGELPPVMVFYFSGHGCTWHNEEYLILMDGLSLREQSEFRLKNISVTDIATELARRGRDTLNFLLLDCCRNTVRLKDPGFGSAPRMPSIGGTCIVYATRPGDSALDTFIDWNRQELGRLSPFCYAFNSVLMHRKGENMKHRELFGEVRDRVAHLTSRRTGPQNIDYNQAQIVTVEDSIVGQYIFRPTKAMITAGQALSEADFKNPKEAWHKLVAIGLVKKVTQVTQFVKRIFGK